MVHFHLKKIDKPLSFQQNVQGIGCQLMFSALCIHVLREITPPSPKAHFNPKRQVEV